MTTRLQACLVRVLATTAIVATIARAEVKTTDETWRDDRRDRDVPVRVYLDDATTKPAPVILLSHGLGGSFKSMAYAATAWASHGYVVVALQHVGSDESVLRGVAAADRVEALTNAINVRTYVDRCRDVRFAIDELAIRDDETGVLKGRCDLDHVGLAGDSYGAQTVQAIVGQRTSRAPDRPSPLTDRRVTAAVAFSPLFDRADPKTAFADVVVPCFHFTGTKDTVGEIRDTTVEQRRAPFDAIAAPEQYLVVLDGGDHLVFNGTPSAARATVDPPQYDAWHALIVDLTMHFWAAELRDDPDAKAWLHDMAKDVVGKAGTFESKATTKPQG